MAPQHQSAEATDKTKRLHRFNPASQSDSAVSASPPTEVEERHPSQPRPTHVRTLTHRARTPPQTSHMASTIWHTVEFSRNRRASPRDLSTRPRGFVVPESYLAFRPHLATLSGCSCGPWKPVPHTAPGRTKRREGRSRGGHPWGPATVVRSAVSVPPSRATSRTLRVCCGARQIARR